MKIGSPEIDQQYHLDTSGTLLPRMDSRGILDVAASAAGLYLSSNSGVLPPDQYPPEEILSAQDLTEEDRKLAAALVAVQFVQQQKHQQLLLNDSSVNTTSVNTQNTFNTITSLSGEKMVLNEEFSQESLLISGKSDTVLQSFPSDLPILTPANPRRSTAGYRTKTTKRIANKADASAIRLSRYSLLPSTSPTKSSNNQITHEVLIKTEQDEELPEELSEEIDTDIDDVVNTKTSRKSLPHKKRISRKLKTTPIKNDPTPISQEQVCCKCGDPIKEEEDRKENNMGSQSTFDSKNPFVFSCQLCPLIYDNQLLFYGHLKTHYEPTVTADGIPLKKTHPRSILKSSAKVQKPFKCQECGKTFQKQRYYDTHIKNIHPPKKVVLVEEFSEPEDLMEGIHVVVDNEGCITSDIPGTQTLDNSGLLSNTIISSKIWYQEDAELHATEADLKELDAEQLKAQLKSNTCTLCGAIFEQTSMLEQHMTTCYLLLKDESDLMQPVVPFDNDDFEPETKDKKGNRKKKYSMTCATCQRVFHHRNSYVYHLKSHSGERPHQCEHCGKSFFAKSALKVHMRLHTGVKPYKCEFCEKSFRQWGDLKYHCISIHSNQKHYQCEYCGKDFARKYSLIVHRRIHTGEKNYECEFCKKTFRASSYLQNHRKIHTGEKPHSCEICGKPFRVRSDMKRHLNTHNKYSKDSVTRPKTKTTKVIKATVSSDSEGEVENTETEKLDEAVQSIDLKTESSKSDSQEVTLQTPKEEDILYTVPADPLAIREGNNTVYVWPVYMT